MFARSRRVTRRAAREPPERPAKRRGAGGPTRVVLPVRYEALDPRQGPERTARNRPSEMRRTRRRPRSPSHDADRRHAWQPPGAHLRVATSARCLSGRRALLRLLPRRSRTRGDNDAALPKFGPRGHCARHQPSLLSPAGSCRTTLLRVRWSTTIYGPEHLSPSMCFAGRSNTRTDRLRFSSSCFLWASSAVTREKTPKRERNRANKAAATSVSA